MLRPKETGQLLKEAASNWSAHNASTLSGSLAYSTVFSIAPLLGITIAIAGLVFGAQASQGEIFKAISGLVGPSGAAAIEGLVKNVAQRPSANTWATIIGVVTLLIGASSVFSQLQTTLNMIWQVRVKPDRSWRGLARQRLLSFSMILVIAFLLLVSLVITAALSAMGKYVAGLLPGSEAFWHIANIVVSFLVTTLLFAAMYKILPDVKLRWRDVWMGGAVTALFFSIGKFLIGLYLGKSTAASAYGAAGSLVLVLLWVYYSSAILFFGAEFTRAYALRGGRKVEAVEGAELMTSHPEGEPPPPEREQIVEEHHEDKKKAA